MTPEAQRLVVAMGADAGAASAHRSRYLTAAHLDSPDLILAMSREHRGRVAQLAPASRPCVETALTLYSEILDRIEEIDFEIFSQRARVGRGRRIAVAGAGVVRAWGARLRHRKE